MGKISLRDYYFSGNLFLICLLCKSCRRPNVLYCFQAQNIPVKTSCDIMCGNIEEPSFFAQIFSSGKYFFSGHSYFHFMYLLA